MEDWYPFCSGVNSIGRTGSGLWILRRTGTGSVGDSRVYGRLGLGL